MDNNTTNIPLSKRKSEELFALIAYGLYFLSAGVLFLPFWGLIFSPAFFLTSAVVIFIMGEDNPPAWLKTHYLWIYNTFLLGLAGILFAGAVYMLLPTVRWIGLALPGIWLVVRSLHGTLLLLKRKEIANPKAIL